MDSKRVFYEALVAELRECQAAGELVGFHLWEDDLGKFIVGTVQRVHPDSVSLYRIAPDGEEIRTDPPLHLFEVLAISRNSEYIQRLALLAENRLSVSIAADGELQATERQEVGLLLERSIREGRIVTIETPGHKGQARVRRCEGDLLLLEEVTEAGRPDGTRTIRRSLVTSVTIGGSTEIAVELALAARGKDRP
jgi:hypothetical protein